MLAKSYEQNQALIRSEIKRAERSLERSVRRASGLEPAEGELVEDLPAAEVDVGFEQREIAIVE